jgi:hypothetical protein
MEPRFFPFLLAFVERMNETTSRRGDDDGMICGFTMKTNGDGNKPSLNVFFVGENKHGSAIDAEDILHLVDVAKSFGLRLMPNGFSGMYSVTLRSAPEPPLKLIEGMRSEDIHEVTHKRKPVPDKPESEWKDGDEITRAQAIQRLGMTPSYFRDLLAAEKIRVHRVTAKMHKYIWGEVREDWIKVRDAKV